MNDVLLLAVLQSLDAGDVDTARGLADLAGDDAAIETLLGDDVAESVQGPKGPPPFPGAVFDAGRHRWVKPDDNGGEGRGHDLVAPSVRDKYARILRRTPEELKPDVMKRAKAEDEAVQQKVRKLAETKIVNPTTGEPMLVFHGTRTEFDSFADRPTYFTPDADYGFIKDSPTVHAAYVHIKNPYYTKSQDEIEAAVYDPNSSQFIADLKAKGYDGIVHAKQGNLTKGPSGFGDDRPQFLVFNSDQIIPVGKYDSEDFGTRLSYGNFDPDGAVHQEALSDFLAMRDSQSKA